MSDDQFRIDEGPIVCAAIRKSGQIICSPRHFDPVMHSQIKAYSPTWQWGSAEQGFVNCKGRFLTREQALSVAMWHGQRKRRCGGDDKQLFSENLY